MQATRSKASFLLFVLALLASFTPAAASLPKVQGLAQPHSIPEALLERLEALSDASLQVDDSGQEASESSLYGPHFSLQPQLLTRYGEFFPRALASPTRLLQGLEVAPVELPSLLQTRVPGFRLFAPDSRPVPNRVSRGDTIGFSLGLGEIRGGRDSSNIYAFVGWQPNMGTDPLGLACQTQHGGTNPLCNPMNEMELSSQNPGMKTAWAVTKETVGNTVSDALLLNVIADAPHTAFDPELPAGERVLGTAKGTGAVAVNVVGGMVVGKAAGWVLKSRPAQWVAGKLLGSRLGQKTTEILTKDLGSSLKRLFKGADEAVEASTSAVPRGTGTLDDLLQGGRQVSGRFPRTAGPNEVLLRRDATGRVTHYQVFDEQGLALRRVDVTGRPHGDIPTPHVLEFERHINPTSGEVFVKPGRVRQALPEEIP